MVEALDVLSSSTDFCFSFWKAISKSLLSNHRLKLFQVGFQELQGLVSFFFFKIYLFIFRQRGREGEREKNINVWLPLAHPQLGTSPATQACALTGNRTSNPLVHRLAPNPLSHTSEGRTGFFNGLS